MRAEEERMAEFVRKHKRRELARTVPRMLVVHGSGSAADFVQDLWMA